MAEGVDDPQVRWCSSSRNKRRADRRFVRRVLLTEIREGFENGQKGPGDIGGPSLERMSALRPVPT